MIYDLTLLDDPDAVSDRTLLDVEYVEMMCEQHDFEAMHDHLRTNSLLLLAACYAQSRKPEGARP